MVKPVVRRLGRRLRKRCYGRYGIRGRLRARITVNGVDGKVWGVEIRGRFRGTRTGRCARRILFKARFPRFRGGRQTITFPFALR
jgi:hypothetical protein